MRLINNKKRRFFKKNIKIGMCCTASITVEAALLYPILILLVMFCLSRTISLYESVRQTAEAIYIEETVDTIDIFRKKLQMEKVKDALKEQAE